MSQLFLGSIFSMPEGLPHSEYEKYYECWIKPFFSLVYANPEIKFYFYVSGSVLEYLHKHKREGIDLIKEFSRKKQIELLNGMYNDNAPALQPKTEQKEQLEKLSHYIIVKHLAKHLSKGCWINPGTFEQSIVVPVRDQGMDYMLAERSYLEPMPSEQKLGLVDVLGKRLIVVPFDDFTGLDERNVEYIINNMSVQDEERYINVLTKYLPSFELETQAFFKTCANLLDKIKKLNLEKQVVLPSEVIKSDTVLRNVCRIRSAPYGIEESHSFFNYLTSRYESRLLYSYFIFMLKKVSKYKSDKTRKNSAKMQLSKAQSHFSFWAYNESWGIHNAKMRQHVYQELGNIEENFVSSTKTDTKTKIIKNDFNLDGADEVIIQTNNLFTVLETSSASMILLQKRQKKNKRWNYLSCYSTTPNPSVPPYTFREILLPSRSDLLSVHRKIVEDNYLYSIVRYEHFSSNANKNSVSFETSTRKPIKIVKTYGFENYAINISYNLSSMNSDEDHKEIGLIFAVEANISISDTINCSEAVINLGDHTQSPEEHIYGECKELVLTCKRALEKLNITYTGESDMKVSLIPVFDTHAINGKNVYQHHSILIYQSVSLSKGFSTDFGLNINFSGIRKNQLQPTKS